MQLILSIALIISIVSIVLILICAIGFVNRIDSINFINPGVLDCRVLQLKDNANDPTNSGMTFWGKKGDFSILLAFTVICKYFMRSF